MSQPTATNFQNLVELLQESATRFPTRRVFGEKKDDVWRWTTYQEFSEKVDACRGGLAALGVGKGDTVAMISANRLEWAVAAYATYGLGARFCPMYESQQEKDWHYILKDSGAKVALTSTWAIQEAVSGFTGDLPELEHVRSMALPAEDAASYAALEAAGRAKPVPVADLAPELVCGFIYTSGTTGMPKGVLLSHGNICSNINGASAIFPIDETDISVSFLPWAHSFGQTAELHGMLARGACIAIAESVDKLIENFAEVRPTVLFSVPRIFNRIYDGVQKKMAEEGGLKKALFDAGLANADRRGQLEKEGKHSPIVDLKHAFFDKLVFSKVRERFGGRLRYAVSGGAALAPEVGEFIDKLGIYVCEGYGLTETSPVVTANMPGRRKLGSVGLPLPGVEVIIDRTVVDDADSDDGEVVVKGPNVMQGYHGLEAETKAVMTADGAFRTGDLGRLDKDGFLFITGRLKEQYKLENGKYVVPAPLEEQLQISPFITQAFIDGANKPKNVALVVPDRLALEKWAGQNGLGGSYEDLLREDRVQKLFEAQIEEFSKGFKGYEKIKRFHLIAEEFSIDNGMLTPKMSLKRRVVKDRYDEDLNALHAA